MSNKKKSIYIVVNGRKPGIYSKWFGVGETAEQVEGFPEAIYKGFYTREEALNCGHNSTKNNERCDQLALEAVKKRDLPLDEGFENPRPTNPTPLFSILES